MAFQPFVTLTRFNDDPARIEKKLQQQTDQGRWYIDTPGPGANLPFALDPQIIPQKWGANLWTNSVDIQSSLLGIDKRVNRDCLDQKIYKRQDVYVQPIQYPVCESFLTTEQSRVIMPAWTARDLQQNHAYILPNNPQAHTEMGFSNNVSSRIFEKDNFKREFDCVPQNNQFYTLPATNNIKGNNIGGNRMCYAANDCSKI
jgi:hypothetical protein